MELFLVFMAEAYSQNPAKGVMRLSYRQIIINLKLHAVGDADPAVHSWLTAAGPTHFATLRSLYHSPQASRGRLDRRLQQRVVLGLLLFACAQTASLLF